MRFAAATFDTVSAKTLKLPVSKDALGGGDGGLKDALGGGDGGLKDALGGGDGGLV